MASDLPNSVNGIVVVVSVVSWTTGHFTYGYSVGMSVSPSNRPELVKRQ